MPTAGSRLATGSEASRATSSLTRTCRRQRELRKVGLARAVGASATLGVVEGLVGVNEPLEPIVEGAPRG